MHADAGGLPRLPVVYEDVSTTVGVSRRQVGGVRLERYESPVGAGSRSVAMIACLDAAAVHAGAGHGCSAFLIDDAVSVCVAVMDIHVNPAVSLLRHQGTFAIERDEAAVGARTQNRARIVAP